MNQITDYTRYKKIAVMGGTFNPIHIGHLVAAEAVRQQFGIERVIFVPAGNPPHKQTNPMYNEHRYLMTALAVASNPYFEVSRIETDKEDHTYTVDTIAELKKRCSADCKIYFITGADAIEEIREWKEPEKLLSMCEFVAVTRPGYNDKKLRKTVDSLNESCKSHIILLEIPALPISSTDIRQRVISGRTIKYLVPAPVEEYIYKFGLYSDEPDTEICHTYDTKAMKEKLQSVLTPKRYRHTLGVAQESVKLAEKYGADTEKAYVAGLLHDCAKCFPDDKKLELCEKYNVEVDDILRAQPDLTHSFLGAKIAENEYGIHDKDILNAIAYHTTGKENMSLLEKIVFTADIIEPNREYFKGLDKIRNLAYNNLDDAVICALERTIEFNRAKNRVIHPLGSAALKYIKEEKYG